MSEEPGLVVRQEPDRVDRTKVRGGALLAVLGIGISIGATLFFLRADATDRRPPVPAPAEVGTLETSLILATERGLTMRADQRAALDRWGWADRDAGVATIPIERAMDLIAADGGSSR